MSGNVTSRQQRRADEKAQAEAYEAQIQAEQQAAAYNAQLAAQGPGGSGRPCASRSIHTRGRGK